MNRAEFRAAITLRTGIASSDDKKNQALNEAVAELSRQTPRREVMTHKVELTKEITPVPTAGVISFTDGPIQLNSISIMYVMNGSTQILPPEDYIYDYDYATGEVKITLKEDRRADYAAAIFEISYQLDNLRIDLPDDDKLIRVTGLELPSRSSREQSVGFRNYGTYIVLDRIDTSSPRQVRQDEHIYVHMQMTHTLDAADNSVGTFPAFLDDAVIKGASGYLLKMRARELAEAITTLAQDSNTEIQQLANSASDLATVLNPSPIADADLPAVSSVDVVLPDLLTHSTPVIIRSTNNRITELQTRFLDSELDTEVVDLNVVSSFLTSFITAAQDEITDTDDGIFALYADINTQLESVATRLDGLSSLRTDHDIEEQLVETSLVPMSYSNTQSVINDNPGTSIIGRWWAATPTLVPKPTSEYDHVNHAVYFSIGDLFTTRQTTLWEIAQLEAIGNSVDSADATGRISFQIGNRTFYLGQRPYTPDSRLMRIYITLGITTVSTNIVPDIFSLSVYENIRQPNTFSSLFNIFHEAIERASVDSTLEVLGDEDLINSYARLNELIYDTTNESGVVTSTGIRTKLGVILADLKAAEDEIEETFMRLDPKYKAPASAVLGPLDLSRNELSNLSVKLADRGVPSLYDAIGVNLTSAVNQLTPNSAITEHSATSLLETGRPLIPAFSFGGSSQGSVLDYQSYARAKTEVAEAFFILAEQNITAIQSVYEEISRHQANSRGYLDESTIRIQQVQSQVAYASSLREALSAYIAEIQSVVQEFQARLSYYQLNYQDSDAKNQQRIIHVQVAVQEISRIKLLVDFNEQAYRHAVDEIQTDLALASQLAQTVTIRGEIVSRMVAIMNIHIAASANTIAEQANQIQQSGNLVSNRRALVEQSQTRLAEAEMELNYYTSAYQVDVSRAGQAVQAFAVNVQEWTALTSARLRQRELSIQQEQIKITANVSQRETQLREKEIRISGNIRALDSIQHQVGILDRIEQEAERQLGEFRSIISNYGLVGQS